VVNPKFRDLFHLPSFRRIFRARSVFPPIQRMRWGPMAQVDERESLTIRWRLSLGQWPGQCDGASDHAFRQAGPAMADLLHEKFGADSLPRTQRAFLTVRRCRSGALRRSKTWGYGFGGCSVAAPPRPGPREGDHPAPPYTQSGRAVIGRQEKRRCCCPGPKRRRFIQG